MLQINYIVLVMDVDWIWLPKFHLHRDFSVFVVSAYPKIKRKNVFMLICYNKKWLCCECAYQENESELGDLFSLQDTAYPKICREEGDIFV